MHRTHDTVIHQDPSAIFADNDLLVHPDVKLVLGRNFIEASPAGVAFDLHNSQSVTG